MKVQEDLALEEWLTEDIKCQSHHSQPPNLTCSTAVTAHVTCECIGTRLMCEAAANYHRWVIARNGRCTCGAPTPVHWRVVSI